MKMATVLTAGRRKCFSLYTSRGYYTKAVQCFNRAKEIKTLSTMLTESSPQLSVITGPVDCGKSLLIREVLEQVKQQKIPVTYLNLRDYSFNSVDSLVAAFHDETTTWLGGFKKTAKELNLNMGAFGVTFQLEFNPKETLPAFTKFNDLLKKLSEQLPPRNFWKGTTTPVLVIDEANELNSLAQSGMDGHLALVNLFKWLTLHTKELHRFHTVLISSDSFFHLWVAQFIGTSRYANYVIGHLTKKEIEKYWKETLLPLKPALPFTFEEAYKVCGGSMHLMERLLWEHVITEGRVKPKNFYMIHQEMKKLRNGLDPEEIITTGKPKPRWGKNNLIEIMESFYK